VIHWCCPLFIPVMRSSLICFLFTAPLDIVIIHVVSRLLEAFFTFTTDVATILILNPVHRITVFSLEC
jgi:hypothetical protein